MCAARVFDEMGRALFFVLILVHIRNLLQRQGYNAFLLFTVHAHHCRIDSLSLGVQVEVVDLQCECVAHLNLSPRASGSPPMDICTPREGSLASPTTL